MLKPLIIHPGYTPACIGKILALHAHYYQTLVDFGLPFESKVARNGAVMSMNNGLSFANNALFKQPRSPSLL